MHAEILAFLRQARVDAGVPTDLRGLLVVELGSYNLNGSPREVFTGAATYIGVDWRSGPGVVHDDRPHQYENVWQLAVVDVEGPVSVLRPRWLHPEALQEVLLALDANPPILTGKAWVPGAGVEVNGAKLSEAHRENGAG